MWAFAVAQESGGRALMNINEVGHSIRNFFYFHAFMYKLSTVSSQRGQFRIIRTDN